MSNIIRTTTQLAMHIVREYTFAGSVLIDATCGNGYDTLVLAKTKPSKLYAFDIQQEALKNTRLKLIGAGFEEKLSDGTISIICASHSLMADYVHEKADAIVFNLGYLPGSDKAISTNTDETILAVGAAIELLAKDGIICITMYSGHEEGQREKEALIQFAKGLDQRLYHAAYIDFINQPNHPPDILLIAKK